MIELTDWAADIVARADEAARRLNPDARIRLLRRGGVVEAALADGPASDDQELRIGEATLYVERGLEGLLDVEEPHDRLVLRPAGSTPNVREPH